MKLYHNGSFKKNKNVSKICNVLREVSCTDCTDPGNDFELILTIEMETRNAVEGYFVVNFRRSVITADLRSYGGLKSQKVKTF